MGQTMQVNQFQQTPIKGDSATKVNLNTLSVQLTYASVATLLPGDEVKLVNTDGDTILVEKCLAADIGIGFVFYAQNKDHFVAGDSFEIGLVGAIMFAEASGSIDRGDDLEYVPSASLVTGPTMFQNAGTNPICALALDNAESGDIFRMYVLGQANVTATITGGAINNAPIGQTTPNVGQFTNLSVTGTAVFKTTASAISALTPGTTVSLNPALADVFTLTPAQDETINAASVNAKGQVIQLVITTSGTTSRTLTFGSNFKSTGTLATGVTTAKVFTIAFVSDGTNYNELSRTTAM